MRILTLFFAIMDGFTRRTFIQIVPRFAAGGAGVHFSPYFTRGLIFLSIRRVEVNTVKLVREKAWDREHIIR
jgi:hypothetical protein